MINLEVYDRDCRIEGKKFLVYKDKQKIER